ncbi:MAG: DUF2804 domain-containing protein [Acholeplasmataceae bacterium]|nr:DUF2804 domain-containing protein [Acholeplasmataceae bacterium]
MNQTRLSKGPLLDLKGNLIESGYSTYLAKDYYRDQVKVRGMRIKEWDYYYIGNDDFGIAFTIADNSYLWLTSVTFFDFINKKEVTNTKMGWLSRGRLKLPRSSVKGDIKLAKKNQKFQFLIDKNKRHIIVDIKNFTKGANLLANIVLEPSIKDSMVIATPFKKRKHFYYNQKINLLKAKGNVIYGDQTFDFANSYGVLDWGRGVWTYKNTWYWSSMSGVQNKVKIAFNLGYGFGDTSKATENILFVDDKTYKLDDVEFMIPTKGKKDDFMSDWEIKSKSGNINLVFKPILDRYSNTNVLIIQSNQHQVFGKFYGEFKTYDGKVIKIDGMMGFAEKVCNRW